MNKVSKPYYCTCSFHHQRVVLLRPLTDIPAALDVNEGSKRNREKKPDDVFVLVKEYISSVELRQPPLLAMTSESRASFPLTTSCQLIRLGSIFIFNFAMVLFEFAWVRN